MKHLTLTIIILLTAANLHAANLQHVEELLIEKGLEQQRVTELLSDPRVHPDPQIVIKNLFFSSPKVEVKKTKTMFISPNYVSKGKKFIKQHKTQFKKLEKEYGVPAEVITAILIVETKLGTYEPKYKAFHSYLSLAASLDDDYLQQLISDNSAEHPRLLEENARERAQKRGRWALNELYTLIEIADELGLDPLEVRSSFSGAMGPAQFIPSSFKRYGMDGNGDGIKSPFDMDDAMASIANYLSKGGWKKRASLEQKRRAIWTYNHSDVYVNTIMHLSEKLK